MNTRNHIYTFHIKRMWACIGEQIGIELNNGDIWFTHPGDEIIFELNKIVGNFYQKVTVEGLMHCI